MRKPKFIPEPVQCHNWSGAAAGDDLDPGEEAVKMGLGFHGAWLAAYMIRRFGPPNHGSDDHKNLCSWTLSTPMRGLTLLVTPYLDDDGSLVSRDRFPMSLHFGYRWSPSLRRKVRNADPAMRRHHETLAAALRWAKRTGATVEGEVVTRKKVRENFDWQQTLVEAYRERYPKTPKKWRNSRIIYLCQCALRTTIHALAEPVMVRDIRFSPEGRLDECGPHCEPFEKAGWPCRVDD